MSMMVKEKPGAGPASAHDVLVRGIWRDNPVLMQTLGLCSALAVTNAVANSLAMGLSTTFVLIGSSIIVSACRRHIPSQVRISTYILIIATFVTVADMALEALVPNVHRAMGPYISLMVTNCIVLGRQEAFASKQPVGRSILDAVGNGTGFTLALLAMGIPREILGSGTFLGYNVMGPSFEPWVIMVLPPGGFLMIGLLLVGIAWREQRRKQHQDEAKRAAALAAASRTRVNVGEEVLA
jgi:Na+-translocating ferredoxin:NAD+ oxidoreductase subunit E